MENLPVFKSENPPAGDKLKGKDAAVGIVIASGRKKLAEITNLQCATQPNLSSKFDKAKTQSLTAKDFILQLQHENMGLKKALVDRNKLIESSRVELHNLTVHFEKVKLQNVQLVQANSQLLQELNAGKDKLKALQHELGCKNGLLKALQEKAIDAASQAHLNEAETNNSAMDWVPTKLVKKNADQDVDKSKPSERTRQTHRVPMKAGVRRNADNLKAPSVDSSLPQRQSMRLKNDVSRTSHAVPATDDSQVPVSPVTTDPVYESTLGAEEFSVSKVGVKKKAVNQDACSRRQSRRFKSDVTQSSEDVREAAKDQTSACIITVETALDVDSNASKSVVKEEKIEVGLTAGFQASHRHSTGRPLRNAAVRIQSYKEVPINIKLRRN